MRKCLRPLLFCLAFLLPYYILLAQIPQPPIAVPSPTAASFSKYGGTGVSLFTGTPNINVPIYTISNGNISVPISLSYDASGVKPDQHPGSVGLNWSLNYGGVITREIKDLPDDNNQLFEGHPVGYYYRFSTLDENNWSDEEYIKYLTSTYYYVDDTEPDEFSFNILGASGKFYLDHERNWKVRSDGKISVSIIPGSAPLAPPFTPPANSRFVNQGSYTGSFPGFVITTEDGTQYIFGNTTNAIEYSIGFFNQIDESWLANSWYLTKIIDTKGNEISYTYERGNFISEMYISLQIRSEKTSNGPLSWAFFPSLGLIGGSDFMSPGCSSYSAAMPAQGPYAGKLISPVYIKEIHSKKEFIKFNRSISTELRYSRRVYDHYVDYKYPTHTYDYLYFLYKGETPDATNSYPHILNNLQWEKLDNIEIFSKFSGELERNFSFKYNNNPEERLMLKAFGEESTDPTVYLPPYQFTYKKTPYIGLPDYLVNQTDHWGFYNGRTAVVDDITVFYYLKETEPSLLLEGSLSKITYPTGGTTEFQFQNHTYSKEVDLIRSNPLVQASEDKNAGGLRIRKISDYDPEGKTMIEKEYFYLADYSPPTGLVGKSSGILGGKAQYYFDGYKTKFDEKNSLSYSEIVFSAQPLFDMGENVAGSHIGYSEVVEKHSDGSTVAYKFTNFEAQPGLDEGHMDEGYISTLQITKSPYEPYSSKAFERGKLLSKIIYNATGQPVSKNTYSYKALSGDYARAVKAYTSHACGSTIRLYEGTSYKNYVYPFVLSEEENINYNIKDPTQYHTNKIVYHYDNLNHLQTTRTVESTSEGKNITTLKSFPADYHSNSANPIFIDAMQNAHIHNAVIEEVTYEEINGSNVKILNGELNHYDISGIGLLTKTHYLENADPILLQNFRFSNLSTAGQLPFNNTKSGFFQYAGYKPRVDYSYDNKSNLVEFTVDNYKSKSFLWGYDGSLPIVEVTSGKITEIACTSFEDYEINNGGWTLNNLALINTSSSKLGVKSYTGNLSKSNLTLNTYIVSLWTIGSNSISVNGVSKTPGPGWSLLEWEVNNATNISIVSNGNKIDEVRLHPKGAQMTSYNYKPLMGVAMGTDANYVTTYYDYDAVGRLIKIKDNDLELIKLYKYNYKAQ